MATIPEIQPIPKLDPFKGMKVIPLDEFFTSGHRTCQGCESALVMKLMAKAAGPRSIILGSTGCMYVANTTYYSTSWVIPWMHTQLGSSGSAAFLFRGRLARAAGAAVSVLHPAFRQVTSASFYGPNTHLFNPRAIPRGQIRAVGSYICAASARDDESCGPQRRENWSLVHPVYVTHDRLCFARASAPGDLILYSLPR